MRGKSGGAKKRAGTRALLDFLPLAAYDGPCCLLLVQTAPKGVPLYIEAILITSIPPSNPSFAAPSLPFLTPLLPFSFMGHPCRLPPPTFPSANWSNSACSQQPTATTPAHVRARAQRATGLEGQVAHGEVVFVPSSNKDWLFYGDERRGGGGDGSLGPFLPSSAESPDGRRCM